ncbi:MAG: hypothetical protein ACRC4N_00755 [Gammaproteobacteria bacterium]
MSRRTRPIRSPTVAIARVAGNRQLSIEMNGIVSLCRRVSLVNGALVGHFFMLWLTFCIIQYCLKQQQQQ